MHGPMIQPHLIIPQISTARSLINGLCAAVILLPSVFAADSDQGGVAEPPQANKPNIILVMCDDMGWGDVGFNGGTRIRTPELDQMAKQSLVLDRFYSASAVCSPTRGSVITGRNPFRYGIVHANVGHMKGEEITLYEALKTQGYRTGHFGKWHLGTMSKTVRDSNRGGRKGGHDYSPPWQHGVDVTFATEAKVPTFDPMLRPGKKESGEFRSYNSKGWWPVKEPGKAQNYGTHYWTGPGQMVDPKSLRGDDSEIIFDHAIPFIEKNAASQTPFLAVIWLHAPHLPVVAGKKHTDLYPQAKNGFEANYDGCVSSIDEQMGRLRKTLKKLGIANNTLLAFTSDNGPEGPASSPGSAAQFSGRKRSLHEGGIRVPSLIEWPAKIKQGRRSSLLSGTMDYFPTIAAITGYSMPDQRPIDGINLLPVIDRQSSQRPKPIGFLFGKQAAWSDNRYKIYRAKKSAIWQLFDLSKDPSEQHDIAQQHPELVKEMSQRFKLWKNSVDASAKGADYR